MAIASQDYRDGAAYGVQELARRLTQVHEIGVPLNPQTAKWAADVIQKEMGGTDHEAIHPEGVCDE